MESLGSPREPWQPQQAGIATTADLMTLQQQIRQEMADSSQRVREEMHTAINGRLDAISSISSAMQRLSAGLAETAEPCRISDLIPKSWDGSHDKGQFPNFMAELHLWMQAWSDQGVRILVRVEGRRQGETLNAGCGLRGAHHGRCEPMGRKRSKKGTGKTSELAVQAVYKGTGAKGVSGGGKGPSWSVQKNLQQRQG